MLAIESLVSKLVKSRGIPEPVAQKLAAAGLGLPSGIREAKDSELKKAGLSKEEIAELREKLPAE